MTIDLREYCQPQSFMVRFWHVPKDGVVLRVFAVYAFSLVLGIVMLGWVVLVTVREPRGEYANHYEMEPKVAPAL